MKNSIGLIGNRPRDLWACSAVPQPTASPRTLIIIIIIIVIIIVVIIIIIIIIILELNNRLKTNDA
jgi:heme/copper-type cytochrome/quinol oxidase subunit 2